MTKDEDKAAQFQEDRSGGGTLPLKSVECDKFHLLVDPVLGRERAARLATLVAEMDTLENVQSLTAMLR